MNENDILAAALEAGIMISTAHGQKPPKLMPVSDRATLIEFVSILLRVRQGKAGEGRGDDK